MPGAGEGSKNAEQIGGTEVEALTNLGGDLFKYYIDGGMVMHFISVLSIFSLTAIIYKLIVFRKVIVNSITIGRNVENRTNTHPGRSKSNREVICAAELLRNRARNPSLPRRTDQETAVM